MLTSVLSVLVCGGTLFAGRPADVSWLPASKLTQALLSVTERLSRSWEYQPYALVSEDAATVWYNGAGHTLLGVSEGPEQFRFAQVPGVPPVRVSSLSQAKVVEATLQEKYPRQFVRLTRDADPVVFAPNAREVVVLHSRERREGPAPNLFAIGLVDLKKRGPSPNQATAIASIGGVLQILETRATPGGVSLSVVSNAKDGRAIYKLSYALKSNTLTARQLHDLPEGPDPALFDSSQQKAILAAGPYAGLVGEPIWEYDFRSKRTQNFRSPGPRLGRPFILLGACTCTPSGIMVHSISIERALIEDRGQISALT